MLSHLAPKQHYLPKGQGWANEWCAATANQPRMVILHFTAWHDASQEREHSALSGNPNVHPTKTARRLHMAYEKHVLYTGIA